MQPHLEQTIADFEAEKKTHEDAAADAKRTINKLLAKAGFPPRYPDVELVTSSSIGTIRTDQWYGIGISTAIREFLVMRRNANMGAATVNEIHGALAAGGFKFETKDEENAKRGLRISLTKNTSIFHRLPDGKHYGLLEWYPDVKVKKEKNGVDPDGGDATEEPDASKPEGGSNAKPA